MLVIIKLKAPSLKEIALFYIPWIFIFTNINFILLIVDLSDRTSEEYLRLFPLEHKELKHTTQLLLLYYMIILATGFILCVYVYILDSTQFNLQFALLQLSS